MSSSVQRHGWESLSETDNSLGTAATEISDAPTNHITTLREKTTWCNLIAMLQQKNLAGFRLSLVTSGDPVGKGTYFAVWRHRIGHEEERLAYQDQDRKILPVGTIVALKRVIPHINSRTGEIDLDDSRQLRALALEVRALSVPKLRNHPNIVTLIGVVWEPRESDSAAWPTLVLEYCDANLSECQRANNHPLPLEEKLRLAKGVAAGLAAMHSLGMVHGDIKSENILLKFDNTGYPTPQLADFSCSLLDPELDKEDAIDDMVWVGGTDPWRAPECLHNGGLVCRDQAPATDLFSLGLLFLRLMNDDKDPFSVIMKTGVEELDKQAKEEMKRSDDFPVQAKDMVMSFSPTDTVLGTFAESVYQLLQRSPSVRMEGVSTMEFRTDASDFSFYRPKNLGGTQESLWHSKLERLASSDPTINIRELCRSETLDDERKHNIATRKKIFEELRSLVEAFRRTVKTCPGCCSLSPFDAEVGCRPTGLGVEDYLRMAQNEMSVHICTSHSWNTPQTRNTAVGLPRGMSWGDFRADLQLFTCFLDSFGVESDVDKALDCLVSGAERGITNFQHDLAVVFHSLHRPIPAHLPVRKWMMSSVVYGNFDGSAKLLAKTDHQLFSIARQARFLAYDGISFLSGNFELKPTAAEEEAGYTILHSAAGSATQPLDYIRQLCGSSTWNKFSSKFTGRSRTTYHVDCPSKDGNTPLLVACRAQRRDVIQLLLSLGASVTRATYSLQDTPLHWVALMHDCKAIIDAMIARGANVNALSKSCLRDLPWALGGLTNFSKTARVRGTPLFWAVATGNIDTTRCLVDHGAEIELAPPQSMSPLEVAVSMGRPDLVEAILSKVSAGYLIKRNVFWHLIGDMTLTKRCFEQHSEYDLVQVVTLLSRFCPRSNLDEIYEFFKFSMRHSIEGLGFELAEAILLCLDGCSKVCGAVPGKPLDSPCWTPWTLAQSAVRRDDSRILELVLRFGASLHPETLHILARYGGNADCIPILLKYGAEINSHNTNGPFTPFGFAVLYGNIDIAKSLAENMTADQLRDALGLKGGLEMHNGRRLTLLGAIISRRQVSRGYLRGIEYLLSLPLDMDAANFIVQPKPVYSALQLALDDFNLNEGFFQEFSNLPLFRFLLDKYPLPHHINFTDTTGYSPLHTAAWLAKLEECELLVEAGADINLVAEENRTALDCCFLYPPPGMGVRKDGLGPTREMVRRFEERRNACANFLRSQGARSGIFEISKDSTMEEFRMPFPERWRDTAHPEGQSVLFET